MHPQAYLKTFWRLDLRPQIFVAMSFAPQYEQRFTQIIAPAIEAITVAMVHALISRFHPPPPDCQTAAAFATRQTSLVSNISSSTPVCAKLAKSPAVA